MVSGNIVHLIHEDAPRYDGWLKLLLGAILALTGILGFALIAVDLVGAYICLGATIFDALLFHAILPRSYQIYSDRVRIVLGWPFAFNIRLDTVKETRSGTGSQAFAYSGLRFATSSRTVVELVRNKGMNVVISPANREAFLSFLNEAVSSR